MNNLTKKLTKKQFIELVKNGPVQINEDTFYAVVKMNDEQIKMSEMFKEQLIKEGKYDNSYVGILASKNEIQYGMEWLPIYGSSTSYVTKHLVNSFEEAVMKDLASRNRNLLNRHFEFNIKN